MSSRRAATIAALAVLLAAPAAARSLAEIQKSGELVVLSYLGSNHSFLALKAGGGYEGIDYDLVSGFARTLGVELRLVIKPRFGELIPALVAGEGDLIASTMSITAGREQLVDFSRPYFPVVAMVLARRGSGISGLGALAGKRCAVPPSTTLEQRAQHLGFASVVAGGRGEEETLENLQSGSVDVVVIESTAALPLLAREKGVELVGTLPGVERYGLAVPNGSDLRAAVDAFLATTRKGRSFYQIVLRHLGEKGVELMQVDEAPPATR